MLVTDPKEKANCICKNISLLKIIQNVSKKKKTIKSAKNKTLQIYLQKVTRVLNELKDALNKSNQAIVHPDGMCYKFLTNIPEGYLNILP